MKSIIPTVVEFSGDRSTRWDWNDDLGHRLLVRVDTSVANQIVGGDICDRLGFCQIFFISG